jgi:ribosome-binding protein aMBF1 (putative translation factor)
MKCALCDKIAENKHHVCYSPELIIAVCKECHYLIHKEKDNLFNPGKGASSEFYNKKGDELFTIIRLKSDTKNKLLELGNKNESYDNLIQRLAQEYLEMRK